MANTFSFEDASTPLDGGTGPSNAFSFEEAAMAPAKPSGLVRRALGDTAVSLGKGVVGAGESLVGLADLATGGLAGKALNKATGYDPKATKAAFDELYSPEQQAANKAVREADGFIPTLGALARNPSAILQSVAESAPSIVGAGGGAQLLGKAGILAKNALARGAISEGLFGAGQQAEQFRQDNPDGTLSARQELASLGSGAGTAAFAGIGGKVAQKLGIADLDTVLAGGKVPTAAAKQGLARRVGEGFVSEGALEEMPQSAWEQMAQNFGNAKPLTEGVGSAAATGLVVGGVMGGGMGAASRSMSGAEKPGEQPAPSQPTDAPIPYTPTTVAEVAQQRNEAMGIDPAAGPLSAVASMAVESQTAEEIRLSTPQILAEGAQAAERARAEQEARMQAEPGIPFEPVPIQGAAAQAQPDMEVPFVDPQIPVQDWINQQTGVGQSAGVTRQDFVSASKEKTDPQIILDESGRPTTTDNLLDIQQFNADRERREALRARNLEAGNRLKSAKTAAQEREEGSPVELIPLSPTQLIQSGGRLDGRNIVNEQGEVMLPNLNIQQYREALQALEESGQSGRPAPARGKNAQGSRQVPGAAPSIALSAPNIAAQAPGIPAAAPTIPQEAPNGATRPDPAEVAAGRDPQGSVDARGVVDPGAGGRSRAGGQSNGNDAAQPAAGMPNAGASVGVRPKNLLQLVRQAGGVSLNRKADVTGDRNSRETVGVFRSGGMDLDGLAELLHQNGFLTDADIQDQSGADKASELLREALKGNRPLNMADNEAAMSDAEEAQYRDDVRRRADALGIKWRFRKIEDVEADVTAEEERASLDENSSAYDIERVSGSVQDVLDEFDSFYETTPLRGEAAMRAMGFTEEEIREAIQSADAEAKDRGAEPRGQEASGEADRGQDRAGENFLESYSEKDLAARAEAQRLDEERRAGEEKRADEKAQADAARDSFTLTGSDRPADVLATQGQGGLFDQQAPAANQNPIKTETRAKTEAAAGPAAANQETPVIGRMVSRLGETPSQQYRNSFGPSGETQAWEPREFTMRRSDWDALQKVASGRSGTKNGTKLTIELEDVEDRVRDALTVQSLHQTVTSMKVAVSRLRTVWDQAASQARQEAEAPASATPSVGESPSQLEALFSDLNSPSTRKANKARKAAAKLPEAARIEYVQANFHDLLIRLMDAGKLEVNGVASLTEENQSCL